jgi:uncharacterized protein (DUF2384 family)
VAYIRITRPPNVTADTYEKVNAQLEAMGEQSPPGMLVHAAGEVDGKWQIVDVWESEQQARQFYEGPSPRPSKRLPAWFLPTPHTPHTSYTRS